MSNKNFKEKIILPDEKVLVEFGISRVYSGFWFFLGFLILISSIIISLFFIRDFLLALLVGLFLIGYGFYLKKSYFYFLTDKRVIFYFRFLSTQLTSIDYQKITDINVRENFLEKIFFGSGDLAINTAGMPKEEIVFTHVNDPYGLKRKLDEIRSAYQKQNL